LDAEHESYLLELDNKLPVVEDLAGKIAQFDLVIGLVKNKKISLVSVTANNDIQPTYFFSHGLIGEHFSKSEEIKFASINGCFSSKEFSSWFYPLFPEVSPSNDELLIRIKHKFESYKLEKSKIDISFSRNVTDYTISRDSVNCNISIEVSICFLNQKLSDFLELVATFNWFEIFVSLCSWSNIKVDNLYFKTVDSVQVDYFPGYDFRAIHTDVSSSFIHYSVIQDNLSYILDKWFIKRKEFNIIGYILVSLFEKNKFPVEIDFNLIAQAAETLHRRFFAKEETQPLIDGFLNNVKEFINSQDIEDEIKERAKDKLKNFSDPSFRKRIEDLKNNMPYAMIENTIINDEKFSANIATRRNCFTHWNSNSYSSKLYNNLDSYTDSLKLLVSTNLFKLLGINEDIMVELFRTIKISIFGQIMVDRKKIYMVTESQNI
jgi:hypothetical protein